ncbi:MAG TPA: hypothetical protein VK203_17650 [Nostocaceae cyanobacterium]|nr:hypothetical protein [Nostocaceae cyanobacterium]
MLNEFESNLDNEQESNSTLYAVAMESIKKYIKIYLDLAKETKGFAVVEVQHIQTYEHKLIILAGISSNLDAVKVSAEAVVQEWERRQALIFDVEKSVTQGVYLKMREVAGEMITQLRQSTNDFQDLDVNYIQQNPQMLPILQRLANIRSKSELKKQIGSVSDNSISKTASEKLLNLIKREQSKKNLEDNAILQSIEPTLEGIVRDLVGRVLLESIVMAALDEAQIPYKKESQYKSLKGVLYDFRADFVIPDENHPKAFIEVRKSSSRHASLYAKDKMFSAINWKGRHKDILAILIVDGEWTEETLRVMANVFDYVVPIKTVSTVVNSISQYLHGDKSKLKWLIDFSIKPANE